MDPVLSASLNAFATNDRFIAKALDGLSEADARKHPGDANPIFWILGHIAVYRNTVAALFGAGSEVPWAAPFKRLSQPDPNAAVPSLSEIHAAMTTAVAPTAARFAELTDAELNADAPFKLPTPDPTMRGLVAFFAYHEAYHLGQIAYVVKWLGKPGIVDGQ
jgi:uncharacterized damage-inducible protein DinB